MRSRSSRNHARRFPQVKIADVQDVCIQTDSGTDEDSDNESCDEDFRNDEEEMDNHNVKNHKEFKISVQLM